MSKVIWERGYYDNGSIRYETPRHEGKLHGIHKTYYDNGRLGSETSYCEGKLHGVYRAYYYSDGKLSCELYYINGTEVLEQEWRRYELTIQLAGIDE